MDCDHTGSESLLLSGYHLSLTVIEQLPNDMCEPFINLTTYSAAAAAAAAEW
jgi:hypothetical protein